MAGIQPRTEPGALVELLDRLVERSLDPAQAVAAVADRMARAQGWRLRDAGLRLAKHDPGDRGEIEVLPALGPSDLGRLYELLLTPKRRRSRGVHLTPLDVAEGLVGLLEPEWLADGVVVDPTVGGGAFLLAACDRLVAEGVAPEVAWQRMAGVDIDPTAVAVAEAALALQLVSHGGEPGRHDALLVGDGLVDPLPAAAVVVGNPPFLNQLRASSSNAGERRTALRARFGDLVGTYTDEAWLYVAAGLDALGDNGQLAMVQPVSVLAARDAHAVRTFATVAAEFRSLWLSNGKVFDAAVEVCGLHLVARAEPESGPMRRFAGRGFEALDPAPTRPEPAGWGRAGSVVAGVPAVPLLLADEVRESLGDLATSTAGFRDQFYGFAPHVLEGGAAAALDTRPLVTAGMIEPAELRWGSGPFRFAGSRWCRPVLDLDALQAEDAGLRRWVEARLVPKVVVATQTRVIEPWVDAEGTIVPATPVISVEPTDPGNVWRVGAMLLAPPLTALLAAQCFGSALSLRALKFSASDLLRLPLPTRRTQWDCAARMLEASVSTGAAIGRDDLIEIARVMSAAYDANDDAVLDWWIDRLGPAGDRADILD